MNIAIQCPRCHKRLRVPENFVGKSVRCKSCDHKFPADETIIAAQRNATLDQPHDAAIQVDVSKRPLTPDGMPQTIGGFAVHRLLGEGAFGQVFLGYDKKLERWLALKVPHPQALNSDRARHRFEREAKATAQLRHPHIVPVYAAGFDGKHHFLASQFIAGPASSGDKKGPEGLTLDAAVKRRPFLSRESATMVHDLAEALHYAHTCGIIHRDVKPSNVMLDEKGQVHLTDFGLAHLEDSVEKLTHEGAILGTPAYMAPELAKGAAGEAHPACDQYSLGILMYALLCGDVPFSGPVGAVLSQHVDEQPKSPRSVRPDVPQDLETICLKALAKRPADRYENIQEMADDLRRWLDGEPIQARRMSATERLVRWCKKNPLAASLAAAVFLVLVVGTVVASTFAVIANSQTAALREETRRANQLAEDAKANLELAKKRELEAKANLKRAKKNETEAKAYLDLSKASEIAAKQSEAEAKRNLKLATENEKKATGNLELARKNEKEAKKQAALAKENEMKAVAERAKFMRNRYYWDVLAAQNFWKQKMHTTAVNLLMQQVPNKNGDPDPRGFEWYYLNTIWNIPSWKMQNVSTELHRSFFYRNDFVIHCSPNGELMARYDGRSFIRVWDTKTRATLPEIAPGRPLVPQSLTFSPDSKRLMAALIPLANAPSEIRVWDARTGKTLKKLTKILREIDGKMVGVPVRFRRFASGLGPQKMRIALGGERLAIFAVNLASVVDLKTGKEICKLEGADRSDYLAFTNGDRRVTCIDRGSGSVTMWDAQNGSRIETLTPKIGLVRVAKVVVGRDGERLYARSPNEKRVRVLDLKNETWTTPFVLQSESLLDYAVSRDGRRLACIDGKRVVTVWDTNLPARSKKGVIVATFSVAKHCHGSVRLALSPTGDYVFVSSAIRIQAWKIARTQFKRKYTVFPNTAKAIGFLPNGDALARLGGKSWYLKENRMIPDPPSSNPDAPEPGFAKPQARIKLAFLDGFGKPIASGKMPAGLHNCSIVITDHSTQKELLTWTEYAARSVTYQTSLKGSNAMFQISASGFSHTTIKVVDLVNGKLLSTIKTAGKNTSFRFSPDEKRLVSCTTDKIMIWDIARGSVLLTIDVPDGVSAPTFSPDGKRLYAISDKGRSILVWNTGE